MQLLNKIHPAFLKKLDHFLLTRYPVIWRTKAHFFLFYSLILGNIAAFLGAMVFPVSVDKILTLRDFNLIIILSMIFMAFVTLFWGFSQARFPFRSSRLSDIFKTLALYAFGLICLATNVWTFQHVLITKTANVVTNSEFSSDWHAFKSYSILQSYQYEDIYDLSQLDQMAIAPFLNLANKYGVDSEEIFPDNYSGVGQIKLHSYKLNNVLESIEAAKYYTGTKSLNLSNTEFDPDYGYGYHYHATQQIGRLKEFSKASVLIMCFLPGLLFLASLFSVRSLLVIGVTEFLALAGLAFLDESYVADFPVSLSVFFVSVFAVVLVYGKNSFFSRIGLGVVFATLPVMLMVGFFWTGSVFLSETVWAAILSLVLLTGLGRIIQGKMLEPQKGDSLL